MPRSSSCPGVMQNILILTHSWVPQPADTNSRWKKVFSSWNSVPLSCPISNPGLRCLLHSAAFSTLSFLSWCSFRGVTSCCVSSEVCSHGSWYDVFQEPDLFIFCCLLFFWVCQAVFHCQVNFVCRYFSRRFSCTYLRRPQALMSTNGWSSKPSREYAQVCVHLNQLYSVT